MKKAVVVVVALALVFGAGALVGADEPAEVLYACAKSNSGLMRLVDDPSECLPSEEGAISWNIQGVQGEPGPAGPAGPPGPAGEGGVVLGYYSVQNVVPAPPLDEPDPFTSVSASTQFAHGEFVVACEPGDVAIEGDAYINQTITDLDTGEVFSGFYRNAELNAVYDLTTNDAANSFANLETYAGAFHSFNEGYSEGQWRRYEQISDLIGIITCADITP
jgi:hypothetical protein